MDAEVMRRSEMRLPRAGYMRSYLPRLFTHAHDTKVLEER